MNRPILHRAIYLHEAERSLQLSAQIETDALLARIRESDASGCAETDDTPPASPWVWLVRVACSLLLSFVAYELATLVPIVRGWLS
jgi:hypothetical protein